MPRVASDQVPPKGILGNLWNNVATGTAAPTSGVDTSSASPVTIMGHVSGAATLTVYYSPDMTTWYKTTQTIILGAASDFSIDLATAARGVALQSSANVTATATVQAK